MAAQVGGEIVGVDSMQVYRELDVGTAKPTAQEQAAVPHHMIDLVDPSAAFSVAEFQNAGRDVLQSLSTAGKKAIICGGSGLHFRSLVDPLEFPPTDQAVRAQLEADDPARLVAELSAADPDAEQHVDMANPRRVMRAVEVYRLTGATPSSRSRTSSAAAVRGYRSRAEFVAVGIDPGEALEDRVAVRFREMINLGWVEEAGRVANHLGPTAKLAIGYRELGEVAAGSRSLGEVAAAIVQATVSLAKRQRTFFRRDPRIRWIAWHDDPAVRATAAAAVFEEAGVWNS